MTNGPNDTPPRQPTSDRRRVVIHASCSVHQVAMGFTNLVVSKRNGEIELNPHVLRHEALCCIPYQVGRDLEEYLWV